MYRKPLLLHSHLYRAWVESLLDLVVHSTNLTQYDQMPSDDRFRDDRLMLASVYNSDSLRWLDDAVAVHRANDRMLSDSSANSGLCRESMVVGLSLSEKIEEIQGNS